MNAYNNQTPRPTNADASSQRDPHGAATAGVTACLLRIDPPSNSFVFLAREFLNATNRHVARRFGGSFLGVCDAKRLIAQLRGPTRTEAQVYFDALLGCVKKRFPHSLVALVVQENPPSTLTAEDEEVAASLDTSPFRLTQTAFINLSDGCYLVSGVLSASGRPAFAEIVLHRDHRHQQWARIKSAGASQRFCRTFPTESAYREWANSMAEFVALKSTANAAMSSLPQTD